jgi:hypothetical protein
MAWNDGELVKLKDEVIGRTGLAPNVRAYLREVGVPVRSPMPGEGQLAVLPEERGNSPRESSTGGHIVFDLIRDPDFLAFAYLDFKPYFGAQQIFCIKENTGAVYSHDAEDYPMRLINNSIQQFTESLSLYREFVNCGITRPNLRKLRVALRKVDVDSQRNRLNYWPMLLEDLAENI